LDACYVVRDSNGQQLAYLYFEDERSRRIGGEVTKDEARRIAVNDGFYPCRTANSSILIRSSLGNSCGV
jgi:hypothetical protein